MLHLYPQTGSGLGLALLEIPACHCCSYANTLVADCQGVTDCRDVLKLYSKPDSTTSCYSSKTLHPKLDVPGSTIS